MKSQNRKTTSFEDWEETYHFFKDQKTSDRWESVTIKELQVMDTTSPLYTKHAFPESDILLCISGTLPENQYPINYTAYESLFSRAGLDGPAFTHCLKNKKYSELITLLNTGFSLFQKKSFILIRDEKIFAAHSDKYHIMPIIDLLECIQTVLDQDFSGWTLKKCDNADAFTECHFDLSAQKDVLMHSLNRQLTRSGKQPLDGSPMLQFCTSDTASSSACLYPILYTHHTYIQIGDPIRIRHDAGSIIDFNSRCREIFALYKKATVNLRNLLDIPMHYPVDALAHIAKKLKLPIKATQTVIQEFDISRPVRCNALDVYLALWEIPKKMNIQSSEKAIFVQENIAKAMYLHYQTYDHPIAVAVA